MKIKVAGIEKESFVDGEGVRYVIFVQGCEHHCKGCHNPETWDMKGGHFEDTDSILKDILKCDYIDGVTLSGGDPMYQSKSLIDLCRKLKTFNINIWMYTGFKFEEIQDDEIMKYIDVCVDGEYIEELREVGKDFKGSSNQRVIDVQYSRCVGEVKLFEKEDTVA